MHLACWLWILAAICAADEFREKAQNIMRSTPVIDG